MAANSVPWDQNPEYLAACRTIIQPGEPTTYTPARSSGLGTDVTDFQIGTAYYNIQNLPRLFYQLWPSTEWKTRRSDPRPPQKVDQNGQPMFEQYPRPGQSREPILDYPIFRNIDKISTRVSWWELQMWFQLEPRLRWSDIYARMEFTGDRAKSTTEQKFINKLNMRLKRGRSAFVMVSWRDVAKMNRRNKTRDDVLAQLSHTQIAANTTIGSTPGSLDGQGVLISIPPLYLPPGVIAGTPFNPHPLTPPVQQSIVLLQIAQGVVPQQPVAQQPVIQQPIVQQPNMQQPVLQPLQQAVAGIPTSTQMNPPTRPNNGPSAPSNRKRRASSISQPESDGEDEKDDSWGIGASSDAYGQSLGKRMKIGPSRQEIEEPVITPSASSSRPKQPTNYIDKTNLSFQYYNSTLPKNRSLSSGRLQNQRFAVDPREDPDQRSAFASFPPQPEIDNNDGIIDLVSSEDDSQSPQSPPRRRKTHPLRAQSNSGQVQRNPQPRVGGIDPQQSFEPRANQPQKRKREGNGRFEDKNTFGDFNQERPQKQIKTAYGEFTQADREGIPLTASHLTEKDLSLPYEHTYGDDYGRQSFDFGGGSSQVDYSHTFYGFDDIGNLGYQPLKPIDNHLQDNGLDAYHYESASLPSPASVFHDNRNDGATQYFPQDRRDFSQVASDLPSFAADVERHQTTNNASSPATPLLLDTYDIEASIDSTPVIDLGAPIEALDHVPVAASELPESSDGPIGADVSPILGYAPACDTSLNEEELLDLLDHFDNNEWEASDSLCNGFSQGENNGEATSSQGSPPQNPPDLITAELVTPAISEIRNLHDTSGFFENLDWQAGMQGLDAAPCLQGPLPTSENPFPYLDDFDNLDDIDYL